MNSSSLPKWITLIIPLIAFHYLQAQSVLTFSPDGKIIGVQRDGSQKSKFIIQAPQSKYIYFLSYLEVPPSTYSNGIKAGGIVKFFNMGASVADVEIESEKSVDYQIYRYPKELDVYAVRSETTLDGVMTALTSQAMSILHVKKVLLRTALNGIPYTSARLFFGEIDLYNRAREKLSKNQQLIDELTKSSDSLNRLESIRFKGLLQQRLTLQSTLKSLIQVIGASSQVRHANINGLVASLNYTRQELVVVEDSINKYKIKKIYYKTDGIQDLKLAAIPIKAELTRITTARTFDAFFEQLEKTDKTLTYELELLHDGRVSSHNSIQWVNYDVILNDKRETVSASRMTGPLPVLDEFTFLGVQLFNLPLKETGDKPPIAIAINEVLNVLPVDRFGAVRSDGQIDYGSWLGKASGLNLSNVRNASVEAMAPDFIRGTPPRMPAPPPSCDLNTMTIEDVSRLRNCPRFSVNGTIEDTNIVKETVTKYFKILAVIADLGNSSINLTTSKAYSDRQFTYGTRFNFGTAATITLSRAGSKPEDQSVILLDKLEAIQKTYWFGISTGIIVTGIRDYAYDRQFIAATNLQYVEQRKYVNYSVQPVVFLSGYLLKQRLDKKPNFAPSINLGFSLVKPLDNLFFGLGTEPIRHVQLNAGARFGKIQKLSNTFNQYDLNFEDHLEDHWSWGYYVGANFYLRAVNDLFKLVFAK